MSKLGSAWRGIMMTVQRRGIIPGILLAVSLVVAVGAYFGGVWLWGVLVEYVHPKTVTERNDLLNVFVIIVSVVAGFITAVATLGGLYISRIHFQQQRDLDERRAHDDALQAYFEEIRELLTEHKLMESERADDPMRLLVRANALRLLERLDERRKKDLILFLYRVALINKDNTIVDLDAADLAAAYLIGANLRGANLSGANLSDAYLGGANLVSANLGGTILTDADLGDAELRGANLRDANLRNAYLVGADLIDADLSIAELSGANLRDARLDDSDISNANLRGASLGGASPKNAYFRDSNLSLTDLTFADLTSADLGGADLTDADLRGANFTDASLDDAYLGGANLRFAKVTKEQLSSCKSLEGATMPDKRKYEE